MSSLLQNIHMGVSGTDMVLSPTLHWKDFLLYGRLSVHRIEKKKLVNVLSVFE